MKLIVGLGNPGRSYVGTRHNIGFEVVQRLSARLGWIANSSDFPTVARSKFEGLALDGTVTLGSQEHRLLLLEPMTFMNLSGRAVQAAKAFYQLADADLIIVLDDVALPCGKIRLRAGGSDGGHNGLRDIARALGTSEYPRLRVGIDAPPSPVPQKDYVLGRFSPEQRTKIDPAIERSTDALLCWIEKGISLAMNQFNADA